MADLNPIGISASGDDKGQYRPFEKNDVGVDSSGNEIAFASPRGITGLQGITGFTSSAQGITGPSFYGATGIFGQTGILGVTGIQGTLGITGAYGLAGQGLGATGLTGATGGSGSTGIVGDTGFAGITGLIGPAGNNPGFALAGHTGPSINFIGNTGVQGQTGLDATGLQGNTGIFSFGVTGLQGNTGIFGATGLDGTYQVDAQISSSGSLSLSIGTNLLGKDGQQLDFDGLGFTAEDGPASTISLTFGGENILNQSFGQIADTFNIFGTILRTGSSSQVVGYKLLFDSGFIVCGTASTTVDLTSSQTLVLTVTSSGTGHELEYFYTNLVS
jgi:hypothetical protein